MKRPVIGITFDIEFAGGYSKSPWYSLRENYCSAVADVGGIPFPLTHDVGLIDHYLSLMDGLVITGGDYDIDPSLYGAPTQHPTVKCKPTRTRFEIAMVEESLRKNMPILGICGGQQVINVALGGTLIQHIPDEVDGCLAHSQSHPCTNPGHNVKVLKETLLFDIVKTEEIPVNTSHHQAVKEPGRGVVINALAPDGVIEGFEVPEYKFCLGLQWHPEFFATPHDKVIYKAFLEATCG